MSRVTSGIASVVALVVSSGCGSGPRPVPSSPSPAPTVWRIDYDAVDRDVLVDARIECTTRPAAEGDETSVRVASEDPTPASDVLVVAEEPCRGTRPRRLVLESTSRLSDEETEVCTWRAFELASECEGWLVVDALAARFESRPEVEYDELPARGDHAVSLSGLELREHRGEPIDDICPGTPTLDVARPDGTSVGHWEGLGLPDVAGALTLAGHRWLIVDRQIVPLDGGGRGAVRGGIFHDDGADPCL